MKVIGNDDKNVAHLQNKYEYDPQGNVVRNFKRDLIGKENQNIKYDYDELNRLTAANEDHGLFNRNYIYDSLGNLTKESSKEKTVTYSVDGLNRLISKTENAKDTYNYAYDNRGNLIQETNATNNAVVAKYVYDATNRMVKGVNTERGSSAYNYNGLGFLAQNEFITGEKVRKDYVLDYTAYVPRELTEYESESIDFRNIYGYKKISVDVNGDVDGVKLFYHNDRLGSAVSATDEKGKAQARANYDEWGNRTQKQTLKAGARELDLTAHYATHNFDPVMDFYYAKSRMYSAADKRFLTIDPIKGAVYNTASLVQYMYVLNNPLKYIDPLGLDALLEEYMNKNYKNVPTLVVLIEQPVPGTKMAVSEDKDPGHAFVRIGFGDDNPGYYGYYPAEDIYDQRKGTIKLNNTNGRVDLDYTAEWNIAQVYTISKDLANKLNIYADGYKNKPPKYNLIKNNCVDFVISVLEEGNLKTPIEEQTWSLPKKIIDELAEKNGFWGLPRVYQEIQKLNGYSSGDAGEDIRDNVDHLIVKDGKVVEEKAKGSKK